MHILNGFITLFLMIASAAVQAGVVLCRISAENRYFYFYLNRMTEYFTNFYDFINAIIYLSKQDGGNNSSADEPQQTFGLTAVVETEPARQLGNLAKSFLRTSGQLLIIHIKKCVRERERENLILLLIC